jgi:hypothetical protein
LKFFGLGWNKTFVSPVYAGVRQDLLTKQEAGMTTRFSTMAAAVMFAAALVVSAKSMAADRTIFINGARMNAIEVAAIDYLNCGSPVPNGRYWVNWSDRAWGYEGGAQQGYLPDCNAQASEDSGGSQSGYWEDRMFENYGLDTIQNPIYQ